MNDQLSDRLMQLAADLAAWSDRPLDEAARILVETLTGNLPAIQLTDDDEAGGATIDELLGDHIQ